MPDAPDGWLIEEGIAEHRAVRLSSSRIVAAQIWWPGQLAPGSVVDAALVARAKGSARGSALTETGEEVLVDRLPRDASEGSVMRLLVTRAAFHGPGRLKRAQGRPVDAEAGMRSLAQSLGADGTPVTIVRRFPTDAAWHELLAEALAGEIAFPGGTLLVEPTAAMTTIDVDGIGPARTLALAAADALGTALPRLGIGGSVAVDFPTLPEKSDRRAVDAALAGALGRWPHERTAMNGFGLVQLVARSERPSLLQLAAWRRDALVWRALLRRAEQLEGPGALELSLHPRLKAEIAAVHLAQLERRSGRPVRVRAMATLAPETPHAQLVTDE